MSVLHRFSLGYSKTAGEIQKAAEPLLALPPSQLTFKKMEEKRHIVLAVSPLHGGHLGGTFFFLIFYLAVGNPFSKSKRKKTFIKYTQKQNQENDLPMPGDERVFKKAWIKRHLIKHTFFH